MYTQQTWLCYMYTSEACYTQETNNKNTTMSKQILDRNLSWNFKSNFLAKLVSFRVLFEIWIWLKLSSVVVQGLKTFIGVFKGLQVPDKAIQTHTRARLSSLRQRLKFMTYWLLGMLDYEFIIHMQWLSSFFTASSNPRDTLVCMVILLLVISFH